MNNEPLRFTTQCRMCPKRWNLNDLSIPVIGQKTIQERLVNFVSLLTAHLQEKHPLELEQVGAAVRDIYGLEILSRFTHEEPLLMKTMHDVRVAFHRTMQGPPLSDAAIEDRVVRLKLSAQDQEKVVRLCQSLRDLLTEMPQRPENVLVVPS